MACDTCGKVVETLLPLRDVYKTETVALVCADCEKEINGHLRKVQSISAQIQFGLVKRFIVNLKARFATKEKA